MGSHGTADQADLFSENEPNINFGLGTAGIADNDDAPAACHCLHAGRQGCFADIINDYIDPALVSEFVYLPSPINFGAIQHDIGSQIFCQLRFFIIACDSIDNRTGKLGNLDGHAVHSAAGPYNQHGFTGPQSGSMN